MKKTHNQYSSSRIVRFCFVLCLLSFTKVAYANSANQLDVLFIGNSLTSANNIPKLVSDLAASKGHIINQTSFTRGGWTFKKHSQAPEIEKLLSSKTWDYVVLQEQSQRPAFPDRQLQFDLYPFAKTLIDKIKNAQPSADILLYQTMAHKDGDKRNAHVISEVGTYDGMQSRINNTYRQIAQLHNTQIVPVGKVWRWMRHNHPDVKLYTDDRHPNLNGSFLAACVFLSTITKDTCTGSKAPSGVTSDAKAKIQRISDYTLFEAKQ